MLELVGLHAVGHHRYNTLSTGERMRTLIARAMVQKPRLLMLDEPTNGLDLRAREQVLASIEAMLTGGPGSSDDSDDHASSRRTAAGYDRRCCCSAKELLRRRERCRRYYAPTCSSRSMDVR